MARRHWAAAVAAVVVTGIAVAVTDPFAKPRPAELSGDAYPTSTATVTRRSLVAQTQLSATLGYGGAYAVVNQARGMITKLPAVGRVVRQGQVLYRVDGRPVVLLYGPVPAYRALSYGMTGPDVAELNAALGIDADCFGLATYYALERLQHRVGLPRTGELPLGQAVFLPTAARVTRVTGVQGGPARPGTTLLSATSTTPVVTADLPASQQTDVKAGDKVAVTLPSGKTVPGAVSSVGRVATKPRSGGTPTVPVKVTLTAAGLDQASVQVSITTGRVNDALVVPVGALLAQTGGGYAVEVAEARRHHLVAVDTGLFDDAGGLVQVTGPGLSPGQHVVVPTS